MNLRGGSLELRCHSRVVVKNLRCHRSIYRPRHGDRFAHVDGLEVDEFVEVLFDQVRYPAQNLGPGVDIEARPGALIERNAGSRTADSTSLSVACATVVISDSSIGVIVGAVPPSGFPPAPVDVRGRDQGFVSRSGRGASVSGPFHRRRRFVIVVGHMRHLLLVGVVASSGPTPVSGGPTPRLRLISPPRVAAENPCDATIPRGSTPSHPGIPSRLPAALRCSGGN